MARKENSRSLANMFINKTAIDQPDLTEPENIVVIEKSPFDLQERSFKKEDIKSIGKRGRPASAASKAMKNEDGERVPISARVSIAYKKRLKKAALEADKTVDGLIIELTEDWLNKHNL